MRWIDGHLDLAYLALNGRDLRHPCADSSQGCVSLPGLREAGIVACFATIFTEPGQHVARPHVYSSSDELEAAERAGLLQLEYYEQLECDGDLAIVRTAPDLRSGEESDKVKIVLLMEGADPIRSPDDVSQWFARGLRIVGLTWAAGTRYAGGNGTTAPLTAMGRELIRALDAHGIIHDLSHLSDAAFAGVMEHATGRVIASHSNCRVLLEPNQRHLTDDQIKAIDQRRGIIGLNLYSAFLATGRRATIDDCIAHLEHVAQITGHTRCLALGSDMDGGILPSDLPIGLDHPAKLHRLAEALADRGWSDDEIEGFAWRNWQQFLHQAMGGA